VTNSLDVKIEDSAKILLMLERVHKKARTGVAMDAVEAAGKVIVARAKELAPRGSQTGTSRKRSKKQSGAARWNIELHTTIGMVQRQNKKGTVSIIGPKWPDGNKAYFNTSPAGRQRKLWGSNPTAASGLSTVAPQIRNWIVQAAEETRGAQLAAMRAVIEPEMREAMRG
jgi:hypothetical protein